MRIDLANYGYLPGGATVCSPRYGLIQEITTTGAAWRTDRGLRVGDDAAVVVAAYPQAVNEMWSGRPAWLLLPRRVQCVGECDSDTVLVSNAVALMSNGVLRQFLIGVAAAGE